MKPFKGTIALDIDGTLTTHPDRLEPPVHHFLEKLVDEGWQLAFITGRTFSFAKQLFAHFQVPYLLVVQNGAASYQMPEKRCLEKRMIPASSLDLLQEEGVGLLVESGQENGDTCYYLKDAFKGEELVYLEFRKSISPERFQPLASFSEFPHAFFAAGKFFAESEKAHKIAERLQKEALFRVVVIRDPFRKGFFIAHINAHKASKGEIVKGLRRPLIVAGDDYNDSEMLKEADVKIVMGNAPADMHALADIVAPPAAQNGIIKALEEATKRFL